MVPTDSSLRAEVYTKETNKRCCIDKLFMILFECQIGRSMDFFFMECKLRFLWMVSRDRDI